MGIDDVVNSGNKLFADNQEKIQAALKSEQAEQISDNILDGLSGAAKNITGGKYDAHIDNARNAADKAVGTD